MEGGIDDVGLGVLFGLELYRYEFAGLLMHAEHLEAVHGVGPHTISVPRIKHADDIDPSAFDNSISDEIFAKICALIRIAVPYTGMIISTRESKAVREKVLPLGVSQISGASRTSVGGYDVPETEDGCGTRIYRCGEAAAEYIDDYHAGDYRLTASFLPRRRRVIAETDDSQRCGRTYRTGYLYDFPCQ